MRCWCLAHAVSVPRWQAGGFLAALGGRLPFEVGQVTEFPGILETVLLACLPPRVGVKVK